MDEKHQIDFLEIERALDDRVSFLRGLNYSEEEINIRKQEISIMLKIVKNIRQYRLKPLESISTVSGVKYKIGDYFTIPGDELTEYKIVLFPDKVTIRGECNNPAIGKPSTCEVYVEFARKVNKEKPKKVKRIKKEKKRIKKEKKRKKIRIEAGEYFSTITNNTVYKAVITTNKTVEGINKLKSKNAPKQIKVSLRDICIKTKKDYKKQHKAEKNYGKN